MPWKTALSHGTLRQIAIYSSFFWCISHIPNKTGSRNHELLLSFSRLAINQWLPTCTVGEIVSMEFAQFVALYVSGVPWIHGRKPCDSEGENLHFCHTLQARFKPKVHRKTCIHKYMATYRHLLYTTAVLLSFDSMLWYAMWVYMIYVSPFTILMGPLLARALVPCRWENACAWQNRRNQGTKNWHKKTILVGGFTLW